jgi:hypothetical protein
MTDKASSMCVNFMGILQRTHKVKSFHFINDDFNSVFQYYFHDNKILARTFLKLFFFNFCTQYNTGTFIFFIPDVSISVGRVSLCSVSARNELFDI